MSLQSAHHAASSEGLCRFVTRVIAPIEKAAFETGSDLVAAAQAGDSGAYELLVEPRLPRLLRLAYSILGNEADAEDAVQEACLLAWRELTRLRDRDRFEAWLWQIAINACRGRLRSRKPARVREISVDGLAPDQEPHAIGRLLGEDLGAVDEIRRAFARLDPDKRTILVLHHAEERSVVEIAELLGIPEGTAKWRLHAARRALERALAQESR